ncbi:MAG: LysR family transcriptional regulator [Gammaproteobacteria bacterium]|jgi:DNA-binding transcriptional LysR family regulator|nr:LysR family transcriptional regulator [Gammaproteobacteria bacterium]
MKLRFNEERLRCLYVAANLGTMRAAAEKLNMAASSVSRQIHKLETELDAPLIEKGRHRIKLTQAGHILFDYYTKRSVDQEELSTRLEDIKALRVGNITIAIVEGFVGGIISPTINEFISKYSNIFIDVRMLPTTREVIEMVVQDDAHFGVAFDADNENRIHARPAIEQPIKAIVHPEHALAGKQTIKLADLSDSNIVLNQNFRMHEVIQEGAKHENTRLNIVMTTNSFVLLKNCVMNGQGVTFLSDLAVAQELTNGELVSINVDNPVLKNSVAVVATRVGRQLPTSANRLLRNVQESLIKWDKTFNKKNR